jgi:hypothetical protein
VLRAQLEVSSVVYPRRISQLRIVEFQRADGMAG